MGAAALKGSVGTLSISLSLSLSLPPSLSLSLSSFHFLLLILLYKQGLPQKSDGIKQAHAHTDGTDRQTNHIHRCSRAKVTQNARWLHTGLGDSFYLT